MCFYSKSANQIRVRQIEEERFSFVYNIHPLLREQDEAETGRSLMVDIKSKLVHASFLRGANCLPAFERISGFPF